MKRIYLLTVLCTTFISLNSQDFTWANKGGLYAYDYGYGITNDNSGNVYVTGKYEENAIFGGFTLPNGGNNNHDIFLAKYDANGGIQWVSTGGGPSGDYAHGLVYDGANYIYVVGEIEAGGNNTIVFPGSSITLTAISGNDVVLLKYDLNGNLVWARSAGGSGNDKAIGVTFDNAGNIFICGYYDAACTFNGSTTINTNGNEDIFIAKYDVNGNFQWVQHAGSAGRDEPKSIRCDAAGNIYMCGFYSNNATFGSQNLTTVGGSYFDSFVAKYSTNGTLLWVSTAGGSYDEVAWSLTMDNAGLIYIAGEFNASAMFGSTQLITSGNADVFVACYDASGNVQWAKGTGGPLIDRARGISCDGSHLFITGQFGSSASFGSTTLTAADSSDIFFASLTNGGNFISALSDGGTADAYEPLGYESGIAICAEASGDVYATGSFLDNAVFGGTTLSAYGRTDVFVTKIAQLTNVNSVSAKTGPISLYPNPTKGNVMIDLKGIASQNVEASVFNCFGQLIGKYTETASSKMNIDLSGQKSGIYFVEVKMPDQRTFREKIIVQN